MELLSLNDDQFLTTLMKKERSLYLKSIVICTTGPIEVGNSLFSKYIFDSVEVDQLARPAAFSDYELDKGFLSRNVVPFHENAWGMLRYLGADVGERNDSSWLDEGMSLQKKRYSKLLEKRDTLEQNLPFLLSVIKKNIKAQITQMQNDSESFFSFFSRKIKADKITALQRVLACFHNEENVFDILQFRSVVADLRLNKKELFTGFFFKTTQTLIEETERLCHDATIFRLIKDKKISLTFNPDAQRNSALQVIAQKKPPEIRQNQLQRTTKNSLQTSADKSVGNILVNPGSCNGAFFTGNSSLDGDTANNKGMRSVKYGLN